MGKNCWRIVAANIEQLMKTWEQRIGNKETEGHKKKQNQSQNREDISDR